MGDSGLRCACESFVQYHELDESGIWALESYPQDHEPHQPQRALTVVASSRAEDSSRSVDYRRQRRPNAPRDEYKRHS